MIVTFPHMGTLHVVLSALFKGLGCEVLVPPPVSKKTLELGAAWSPETVCLPFKITLGSFIEALENGADTLVTCGGVGPCRLGYYAEIQRGILQALGYRFEMIVIEPDWVDVLKKFRYLSRGQNMYKIYQAFRLAGAKMIALDSIERQATYVRAREKQAGTVDRIWHEAVDKIAAINDPRIVMQVAAEVCRQFDALELNSSCDPLRIGLVGEIFVMLEPYVNLELVRFLGRLGVEVNKTMYLSDYVRGHLMHLPHYRKLNRQLEKLARPYLGHYVGGHGIKSVGQTVNLANMAYDGIVHVFPFSCMPEVIAKNILPYISQREGIPVLSLAFDEQSGLAGIHTRLEAFVDLLRYRRARQPSSSPAW